MDEEGWSEREGERERAKGWIYIEGEKERGGC